MARSVKNIFDDCQDTSEPACLDKVLAFRERIKDLNNEFIEILISKVDYFVITWNRPWYQQSNCLTRTYKIDAENQEDTYRTDKMTKDETDLINENWKQFVQQFNVPDTPICFAQWRQAVQDNKTANDPANVTRHFVTCYLAKGLQRNLPQVYRHFIIKHGYPSKGPYSEIEEKIMEITFKLMPEYAVPCLAVILGREPRGISKRFRIAQGDERVKLKVKWTLDLATKMLNHLMEVTQLQFKKLRSKDFNKDVWIKIEEEMNIPYVNLRYFWLRSLHPQLFIKEDVKLRSLRKRVYKILRHSCYKVWADIRWNEIVKEFPKGYTSFFLYLITGASMRRIPNYLNLPLQEAASKWKAMLKTKKRNYRLKRLKLNEDNKLELRS